MTPARVSTSAPPRSGQSPLRLRDPGGLHLTLQPNGLNVAAPFTALFLDDLTLVGASSMLIDTATTMDIQSGASLDLSTVGSLTATSAATTVNSGSLVVDATTVVVDVAAPLQVAGSLVVQGTLAKGGGSFRIDHPLAPHEKYLSHSFVESPDMMNVYNGNVTTDEDGRAVVTLPDYFAALNRDFRYQLTTIGSFARVMIAEEITENRFVIRSDAPQVRVSWQVTGIRDDAWARANRIEVETDKPAGERGRLLHPRAFEGSGE